MSTARQGPGRPKSESKRERIVAAARELFVSEGITATSMTMIAERAGVARPTLYSHFADKEALFAEVIARVRGDRTAAIGGGSPPAGTVLGNSDILVALAGLAAYLVELITDPELAALRRLLISEDLPAGWRTVWALEGPDVLRAALARDLALRPELDIPDPDLAAEHFLALTTHRASLDALHGVSHPPEHYRTVEACVVFLRAYGKLSGPAGAGGGRPS